MDVNNAMDNMMNIRAKQKMRSNKWGKKLDDALTVFEELLESADEKQIAIVSRSGEEITRVANALLEQSKDEGWD